MATTNEELIERFYGAFAERDGAAMEACYTADVSFWDPVFCDLRGEEAGAMWRMLAARATDLRLELLEREAKGDNGSARWRAHYTFTQTGRRSPRRVRLLSLGAAGAGAARCASRLDAAASILRPPSCARRPGRVHGAAGRRLTVTNFQSLVEPDQRAKPGLGPGFAHLGVVSRALSTPRGLQARLGAQTPRPRSPRTACLPSR